METEVLALLWGSLQWGRDQGRVLEAIVEGVSGGGGTRCVGQLADKGRSQG